MMASNRRSEKLPPNPIIGFLTQPMPAYAVFMTAITSAILVVLISSIFTQTRPRDPEPLVPVDLDFSDIRGSLEKMAARLLEMESKANEVEKKVTGLEDENEKLQDKIGDIGGIVNGTVLPNLLNKAPLMALLQGIVVAIVVMMGISYFIYRRHTSGWGTSTGQREASVSMNSAAVLAKIPLYPVLKPDVCVISYDTDNQRFNHDLVFSGLQQLSSSVRIIGHLIRKHSDILKIPPCVLTVMCIEYSTRHVIIEEKGIGLGDLKRTTLEAVWKMKGEVIILYTNDPGSKALGNNRKYNLDIYCVQSQPEMQRLDKNDQFYSVKDRLTDFQKKCLKNVLKRIFP